MSLLDEAAAIVADARPRCSVGVVLKDDPKLGSEITEALASTVPARAIAGALEVRGIRLGADALQRHRRRACQCPRS